MRVPLVRPATDVPTGAGGAQDDDHTGLGEVLALLRRHLLLIACAAAATTALAAWYAMTRPPRFQSTATIRITDARKALTGGIESAVMERVSGPMIDPVLSQTEVLRTRVVLERAVDASGLRLRAGVLPASTLADQRVAPSAPTDTLDLSFSASNYTVRGRAGTDRAAYGAPVELGGVRFTVSRRPKVSKAVVAVVSREAAVQELLGGLNARQRERTDIVELRYGSGDSLRSQLVLHGLLETFQAVNAERAQMQSRRRRVFVQEQMRATDSLLAGAQVQLSAFQRQQEAFSSRERFSVAQQELMRLEQQRDALDGERRTYEGLLARLMRERTAEDKQALRVLAATPGVAANPVVQQLYTQLARYETTRDSLLGGSRARAPGDPDVQRLTTLIATTEGRIADAVRSQIESIEARVRGLDELRGRGQMRLRGMPDVQAEESRLVQQVVTIQAMADELRSEYQRARIAEAVEVGQIEVLDDATVPTRLPSRGLFLMMLGLAGGLLGGTAAAVVMEHLNNSIRRREDIEEVLRVPNLGVIPRIAPAAPAKWRRSAAPRPGRSTEFDASNLPVLDLRSAASEAYRTLRTNLIFSQAQRRLSMLLVTSAAPGEGKSTTAANLAAAFAQQGMRVLLVDCDLRRARQHEIFAVPRTPGLSEAVLGHASLEHVVTPALVEGLSVLAAGTPPPNPVELLGSPAMRVLLAEMQRRYDVVVLDTPPVLAASEAAILGAGVDGVVLVVRAGHTARPAAREAVRQLQAVGGRIVGAVLNDPEAKLARYGGYSYSYRYQGYYSPQAAAEGPYRENGRPPRGAEAEAKAPAEV